MAIFKALTSEDISTKSSNLRQIVDVINSDIAADNQRRTYEVWATSSIEQLDAWGGKFLDGLQHTTIENTITSGMFETVYDQEFTKQTANQVMDMTCGIYQDSPIRVRASLVRKSAVDGGDADSFPINAFGDFFTENPDGTVDLNTTDLGNLVSYGQDTNGKYLFPKYTLQMREKIDLYRQFAKELLGNPDSYFVVPKTDELEDDDVRIDAALFIRFHRLFKRDGIDAKTFGMRFLYQIDGFTADDVPSASDIVANFNTPDVTPITVASLDTYRNVYNEVYFGCEVIPSGNDNVEGTAGPNDEPAYKSTIWPLPTGYADDTRGNLDGFTVLDNLWDGGADKQTYRLKTYSDFSSTAARDISVAGEYTILTRSGDLPTPKLGNDAITDIGSSLNEILKSDPAYYSKIGKNTGLLFLDAGVAVIDLQKVIDFSQEVAGTIKSLISDQLEPTVGDSDGTILFGGQFVDFLIRACIDDIIDHMSKRFGYAIATTVTSDGTVEGTVDVGGTQEDSLGLTYYDNIVKIPSGETALIFRNRTIMHSSFVEASIRPEEFTYSTNPTYVDTEGRIVVIEEGENGRQAPFAFLTTIGVYDANNNLLGVAKLSRPVEVDGSSKQTFTLRFDF